MKSRNRIIRNIAAVMLVGASVMMMAESAMRFAAPKPKREPSRLSGDCDSFVPGMEWDDDDPLTGPVSINELGFRDVENSVSRQSFVFLGGSETYGIGVPQGERFSDIVGRALAEHQGPKGIQSANVAMPDATPAQLLEMLDCALKRKLWAHHVFVSINADEVTVPEPGTDLALPAAQMPSGNEILVYILRKMRRNSLLFDAIIAGGYEYEWFRATYEGFKDALGADAVPERDSIRGDPYAGLDWGQLAGTILDKADRWGGVTAVLLPGRDNKDLEAKVKYLQQVTASIEVGFLNLTRDLIDHPNPHTLAYPAAGRSTARYHRLIGEMLIERSSVVRKALNTSE